MQAVLFITNSSFTEHSGAEGRPSNLGGLRLFTPVYILSQIPSCLSPEKRCNIITKQATIASS